MAIATQQPPDGWTMQVGTWNTDVVPFDAVRLFGGGSYLKFLGTGTLTAMVGPWVPMQSSLSALGSVVYNARAMTSTGATPSLSIKFVIYGDDKSTVKLSTTLVNATLGTAVQTEYGATIQNTTTDGRWGRFEVARTVADAGLFYLFVADLQIAPPSFITHQSSNVALTNGAYTALTLDETSTTYKLLGEGCSFSGGVVTVTKSGLWHISASAFVRGVTTFARPAITNSGGTILLQGQLTNYAGGGDMAVSMAGMIYVPTVGVGGQTFQLRINVGNAGCTAFGTASFGTPSPTFMHGFRIGA